MSDMTINQIRERRAQAESAISEILLQLCKETGLGVQEVPVRQTAVFVISEPAPRIVDIQATIVLQGL